MLNNPIDPVWVDLARRVLKECDGDYHKARRKLIESRDNSSIGTYTYAIGNQAVRALDQIHKEEG